MAIIPWTEAGSNPVIAPDKPLGQLVQGARNFICSNYERARRYGVPSLPILGPAQQAVEEIICGTPQPLPPPNGPIIPGGKCRCVQYRCNYTARVFPNPTFTEEILLFGPITVAGWTSSNLGSGLDFAVFSGAPDCGGRVRTNLLGQASEETVGDGRTFCRVNGLTALTGNDDCGGQWPNFVPPTFAPPDVNFKVPVTVAPNINIDVGGIYLPPINYIDLSPTLNFDFKPTIRFPDVNLDIGFSLGGINITNVFDFSTDFIVPLPWPDPNPPLPGLPVDEPTDLTEVYRRFDDIRRRLIELEECACPSFDGLVPVNLGNGGGGTVNLPSNSKYVQVSVSQLPTNSRNWFGRGGPDVETCGWTWFRMAGGGLTTRTPIDATVKAYEVPPGATAFAWTVYNNGVAGVTAFRKP